MRRNHRNCESIKSPISVTVSPSNAVKCYPCREVSLNYSDSLLFHGGDTGSTPVRDANPFNHLRDLAISPRVQKSPLTKSLPSECLEESSSPACSAPLAFRPLQLGRRCPSCDDPSADTLHWLPLHTSGLHDGIFIHRNTLLASSKEHARRGNIADRVPFQDTSYVCILQRTLPCEGEGTSDGAARAFWPSLSCN